MILERVSSSGLLYGGCNAGQVAVTQFRWVIVMACIGHTAVRMWESV